MNTDVIWLAIGFVLIIEGMGPMLIPRLWREMLKQMSDSSDIAIRRVGGCLVVAGCVITYAFTVYS